MTRQKTAERRRYDSPHFVREDYLPGGAKLHRFDNGGGAPISAVYFQGVEVYWSPREEEDDMLKDWEAGWRELVPVIEAMDLRKEG